MMKAGSSGTVGAVSINNLRGKVRSFLEYLSAAEGGPKCGVKFNYKLTNRMVDDRVGTELIKEGGAYGSKNKPPAVTTGEPG